MDNLNAYTMEQEVKISKISHFNRYDKKGGQKLLAMLKGGGGGGEGTHSFDVVLTQERSLKY